MSKTNSVLLIFIGYIIKNILKRISKKISKKIKKGLDIFKIRAIIS